MVMKFQGSRFNRAGGNQWNLSVEDRTPGEEARSCPFGVMGGKEGEDDVAGQGSREEEKCCVSSRVGFLVSLFFKLHVELKKARRSC